MPSIAVHLTSRGWFWELKIETRVVAFGWCPTKERAEESARMA